MRYVDRVVQKLGDVVGGVVQRRTSGARSQTVTISRPREEVQRFWRDPDALTAIFDGVAKVRRDGADRYVWTPSGAADGDHSWNATLHEADDTLRFAAARNAPGGQSDADPQFVLTFRDAPRALGTEVTIRTETPLPQLLSNLAAFAVLYRARALLQTGEVPTLRDNPSAR